MNSGIQLPELIGRFSSEEARGEFLHELGRMRSLSLKLFEKFRTSGPASIIKV